MEVVWGYSVQDLEEYKKRFRFYNTIIYISDIILIVIGTIVLYNIRAKLMPYIMIVLLLSIIICIIMLFNADERKNYAYYLYKKYGKLELKSVGIGSDDKLLSILANNNKNNNLRILVYDICEGTPIRVLSNMVETLLDYKSDNPDYVLSYVEHRGKKILINLVEVV